MIRSVIFDVDGTLVDSVDLHARAWQETLAEFGHQVSFAEFRSQIGKGGVVIGDTPYDIEAAARAGLRTIAVRCGGFPEETLRGAVAIYDSPADLLARYADSLLAEP